MPAEPDNAVGGTASGRSVLFLDEHTLKLPGQPRRALDVVRGPTAPPDHVLAFVGDPGGLLPVKVTRPARAAGWYSTAASGSTLRCTPVGLGATRIVVVSGRRRRTAPSEAPAVREMPDVADAAAQVLNAALADWTTEDLAALRRRNAMVAQVTEIGRPDLLTGSTGEPYRVLEFLEVSPPPGEDRPAGRRRLRAGRQASGASPSWTAGSWGRPSAAPGTVGRSSR